MSLAQRVLLTWVFILVFLILLELKLDEKVQWNWFLIFLPIWVFDGILILMLTIRMAGRCKLGFNPRDDSPDLFVQSWHLTVLVLKLVFCGSLCAKLEHLLDVNLILVVIPLWNILIGALLDLGMKIFSTRREA